ncbi:Inner membrane protein ybbJ [Legionella beliardensis]|uniref:Inner membrane protein ybbJ n=1 Tax=Legionella beliardensis TaxID=91822 RepID=A0A378I0L0_9GAMM|nr:NfeD family protein [Legionella beliardensis]STX28126.1 Inner membrane protein ybbJ [Legionella beliardensis]
MWNLLYWHWLALALILIIAETLGAAGFLVALGMAAAATGIITWVFSIGWQWQLIYFSLLCIVFAIAWWLVLKKRTAKDPSFMNKPFHSMLDQTVTLVEPIKDGRGVVRINDAPWFVKGPELPAGTKVKIVAIEGTIMIVEPLIANGKCP